MGDSSKDKEDYKGSNGGELKKGDKKSQRMRNKIQLLTGTLLHCTEKYCFALKLVTITLANLKTFKTVKANISKDFQLSTIYVMPGTISLHNLEHKEVSTWHYC